MLKRSRLATAALLLLGAAACDDAGIPTQAGLPQDAADAPLFSQDITLPQLQEAADSQAIRVEVKLRPGVTPLTAREIEREDSAALREDEKIEGPVSAISAGSLTFGFGSLKVTFDASTRFRSESGDTLTQAEFIARVQEAIDSGRVASVEAERPAPATPQAPGDATFLARELELDDEAREPRLELNIDADNLQLVSSPPPAALLKVLGLTIQILAGGTDVEQRRPEGRPRVRFEGTVESVNTTAGTVTLRGGRVIRLVQDTEVETGSGKLATLAEVAAAIAAGQIVEAEGKGIVESTSPLTILAVEAEFEVEDGDDEVPGNRKLRGSIASVDAQKRTLTLSSGEVVRIVEGTKFVGDSKLRDLAKVAQALADSQAVSLEADAVRESAGPPATYVALRVKLQSEAKGKGKGGKEKDDKGSKSQEFEGRVTKVDLTAKSFTLSSGRVVRLTDSTAVDTAGDLRTLQQVADALADSATVKAEGSYTLDGTTLLARSVKFEVEEDDDDDSDDGDDDDSDAEVKVEAQVSSVDVAGRSFKLADGRTVRLAQNARVEGDARTLQQVADALTAGKVVRAEVRATTVTENGATVLLAHKVEFEVD